MSVGDPTDWFDIEKVALFAQDETTGLPVRLKAKNGYLVTGADAVGASQLGQASLGAVSIANGSAAAFTPISSWMDFSSYSSALVYILNKATLAGSTITLVLQSSPDGVHADPNLVSNDRTADAGEAVTFLVEFPDCQLRKYFRVGAFAANGPVSVDAAVRFVQPG